VWSVLGICSLTHFSLTGQWSSFEMSAFIFLLSLFLLPHSYIRCSTVWMPLSQGHVSIYVSLSLCLCVSPSAFCACVCGCVCVSVLCVTLFICICFTISTFENIKLLSQNLSRILYDNNIRNNWWLIFNSLLAWKNMVPNILMKKLPWN
jgi:hypothetical protein